MWFVIFGMKFNYLISLSLSLSLSLYLMCMLQLWYMFLLIVHFFPACIQTLTFDIVNVAPVRYCYIATGYVSFIIYLLIIYYLIIILMLSWADFSSFFSFLAFSVCPNIHCLLNLLMNVCCCQCLMPFSNNTNINSLINKFINH